MVQSPRKWHHPAIAYATIRRLETHDPAIGSGDSQRSRGVGAQRSKAEPGCGCRCWAAGRSARNAIERPWVVHRAKEADWRAATVNRGSPAVRCTQRQLSIHVTTFLLRIGFFASTSQTESSLRIRLLPSSCLSRSQCSWRIRSYYNVIKKEGVRSKAPISTIVKRLDRDCVQWRQELRPFFHVPGQP
jgi:hypothetical protein